MIRLYLPVSVLTVVVALAGIRIYQADAPEENALFFYSEIVHVVVISALFTLGTYFGFKRMKAREQGLPEDDELSKQITRKAAAVSFYVSLFIWLGLLYIHTVAMIDSRIVFGYGFIGMAVIFVLSWSVLNRRGV